MFRVVASVGAVGVALTTLEIALRLTALPPMPFPRESGENAALVGASRNALDLREPWDEVPGDGETVRIAFLGDSFTFAVSVEQHEGFVHKVEEILNTPGGKGYVTINMGQPGTEPHVQSEMYARLKDALRPDILVHVVYCNDLGHDLYDELKIIHALQNRRSFAAHYSHVWRAVEERVRGAMVKKRTLDYFRGGESPFKRQQAWDGLHAGIERTRDLARGDGTRYVVVMFPWLYGLDDYPLEDVHRGVRGLAEELGVPYLDLLDTFRSLDASELRISVTDEHPNAGAHTLAAEVIVLFLRTQGFVE